MACKHLRLVSTLTPSVLWCLTTGYEARPAKETDRNDATRPSWPSTRPNKMSEIKICDFMVEQIEADLPLALAAMARKRMEEGDAARRRIIADPEVAIFEQFYFLFENSRDSSPSPAKMTT